MPTAFSYQLELGSTEVTDAGLEHLRGLTQLRMLYLWNSKVTGDGVKKLKQALPTKFVPK